MRGPLQETRPRGTCFFFIPIRLRKENPAITRTRTAAHNVRQRNKPCQQAQRSTCTQPRRFMTRTYRCTSEPHFNQNSSIHVLPFTAANAAMPMEANTGAMTEQGFTLKARCTCDAKTGAKQNPSLQHRRWPGQQCKASEKQNRCLHAGNHENASAPQSHPQP